MMQSGVGVELGLEYRLGRAEERVEWLQKASGDAQQAIKDIERMVSDVNASSVIGEFAKGAEQAVELEELLQRKADVVPASLISDAYYGLYEFEMERFNDERRRDRSHDLTKADYYLGRAQSYRENTNDATL